MATIGDSLTSPERYYVRYEIGSSKTSGNINFDYVSASGNFIFGSDAYGLYSAIGMAETIAYIKIKNTSKFRTLLCLPSSGNASQLYTDNMVVEINGTKYTTNLQTNTSTSVVNYYLAVDVTGLSKNTTYIVKIYSESTENDTSVGRFNIQAIDVDTNAIVGFNLNMCNMFKGCTSLTQDITIPSEADSVADMFKGCTSMTHIHSNWNERVSEIISTDCYSGCTAITHIDGENVIKSDYSVGLDQVPISWGGYGFFNDTTTIIEVEIPSDNYRFNPIKNKNFFSQSNPKINWGDGSFSTIDNINDTSQYTHIYTTAGTYIIKGHFSFGNGLGLGRDELRRVLQLCVTKNLSYAFSDCHNLTYVNLSATRKGCAFGYIFRNCNSLETVDGLEYINPTETASMFTNCTSLTRLNGVQNLNMSNVSNASRMFNGCSSLTSLNISNWNTSNVTDMSYMFANCSSLTSLNLNGWNVSNVVAMNSMFNEDHYLSELNLSTWVDNGTKVKSLDNFFSCNNGSTANEGSFITVTLPSIKVNNAIAIFAFNKHIKNADFTNLDFSECESMWKICGGCSYLETATFNVEGNYDNITDIREAFLNCSKLISTNLMEVI